MCKFIRTDSCFRFGPESGRIIQAQFQFPFFSFPGPDSVSQFQFGPESGRTGTESGRTGPESGRTGPESGRAGTDFQVQDGPEPFRTDLNLSGRT